jgi:hypothetical protein
LTEAINSQQKQIEDLKIKITQSNFYSNDALTADLEIEKANNAELKRQLLLLNEKFEAFSKNCGCSNTIQNDAVILDKPLLFQNQPNPFVANTVIRYYLPQNVTDASIQVSSSNGQVLKIISLLQSGNSSISIDVNQLKPGEYLYSLIIKGKLIDTKKMTIVGY